MGTILASAILAKVSVDLNDTANVRWPQAELLAWLNDGQRAAAVLKPSCSASVQSFTLQAGKTKQTAPTGAVAVLDVVRNMGEDGNTPGVVVTPVDRAALDRTIPTWHSDANTLGYVSHTVASAEPHTFYVYPKAPATTWAVEAVFAVTPTEVATVSTAITVDDIYSTALSFYVLARAYGKNRTDTASVAMAATYYSAFVDAMGGAKAQP